MLLIKAHDDGLAKLPMDELVDTLNRLGYSASGQVDAIRGLISTFKQKNNDLIADVNNDEVILSTIPNADSEDKELENKEKITTNAVSQAKKDLGL